MFTKNKRRGEYLYEEFFTIKYLFLWLSYFIIEEEKGRASMSEKVYVNICDTKKCPGPVYAVKTGDTLYSIAQRHHCRVRTLLDLKPDLPMPSRNTMMSIRISPRTYRSV